MASEVCGHCNTLVYPGEGTLKCGYSYHHRCKKCYVCSETNLRNAEIFKGVIFCSGCSRRIFKGCSTARKVKTKSKQRRRVRVQSGQGGVIEIARLNSLMASNSTSENSKLSNKSSSEVTPITNQASHHRQVKEDNLNKNSFDMATITDVTQELLQHVNSQPKSNNINKTYVAPAKPRKKNKNHIDDHSEYARYLKKIGICPLNLKSALDFIPSSDPDQIIMGPQKNNIYSDLRIAELGASTEIAHMALRRQSEVPVIIQSEFTLRKIASKCAPFTSQESDSTDDHLISDYSQELARRHCIDRSFRSILMLPYKSFKKNILNQSSLVSAVVSSEYEKKCVLRRFKTLFQEEIVEHQRRGLRKLFSTINRRKTPYRLGWLDIMAKIPEDQRSNELQKYEEKRCKHYRNSHSYRCMRSQAMKLAGPTRSELALIRTRLKNIICYDFVKSILNFNNQFVYIMTSNACTNESQK